MSELDAGCRAALMHQVDDARLAGHEGIVPQAEIAYRAAATAQDLGRLDHHQAGATGAVKHARSGAGSQMAVIIRRHGIILT